MERIRTPSTGHAQFDALCAGVEDFETLPELGPVPRDTGEPTRGAPHDESTLDEQILAGLVTPS